jgi:hypothetical protein
LAQDAKKFHPFYAMDCDPDTTLPGKNLCKRCQYDTADHGPIEISTNTNVTFLCPIPPKAPVLAEIDNGVVNLIQNWPNPPRGMTMELDYAFTNSTQQTCDYTTSDPLPAAFQGGVPFNWGTPVLPNANQPYAALTITTAVAYYTGDTGDHKGDGVGVTINGKIVIQTYEGDPGHRPADIACH